RAGVDEPHQLREDADLPRLRDGEARGGALRRANSRERDRRPRALGGARRRGGVLSAAGRIQARASAGKQTAAGGGAELAPAGAAATLHFIAAAARLTR